MFCPGDTQCRQPVLRSHYRALPLTCSPNGLRPDQGGAGACLFTPTSPCTCAPANEVHLTVLLAAALFHQNVPQHVSLRAAKPSHFTASLLMGGDALDAKPSTATARVRSRHLASSTLCLEDMFSCPRVPDGSNKNLSTKMLQGLVFNALAAGG